MLWEAKETGCMRLKTEGDLEGTWASLGLGLGDMVQSHGVGFPHRLNLRGRESSRDCPPSGSLEEMVGIF